nr:hypothetical protein [Marinicella sp. W31]MDC2876011.1 hypothetical protein [Marinicella sp. W31]
MMQLTAIREPFRLALLIAALFYTFAVSPAFAQQTATSPQAVAASKGTGQKPNDAVSQPSTPFVADTVNTLDGYASTLSAISEQVSGVSNSDDSLAKLQLQVDQLQGELSKVETAIQARLGEVRAQLTELGSAPGPGESPEPEVTTRERNALLAQRSEINTLAERVGKLATSAEEISDTVSRIRREQFARALFKHTDLAALFSTDFTMLWQGQLAASKSSYGGWLRFIWQSKRIQFIGANLLSILAAFLPTGFPQTLWNARNSISRWRNPIM